MARSEGNTTTAPDETVATVATFETLVQEEQSLKERMQARLTEITPQVEEAEKIQAWLAEHTAAMSANGTEPKAPAASSARKRGGQRRQSGGRIPRGGAREAFLNVVREHPEGITVADVAKALGKPAAYYYRIASDAEKDGQVVRTDDGVKIA